MPDRVVITGTGLFTPPFSISNEELVASLTVAVEEWNAERAAQIAEGTVAARPVPDAEFIERASGIKSRYVMEKSGVLDPQRLRPHLPTRSEDELGLQAEMALPAIHEALAQAGRRADEVDCVIVGCSNLQRAYPAVAIEIQHALGAGGWAYDMNVACSSATFAIEQAANAVRAGTATCVLVVNPEITSAHLEWRDRDCHFIFGDVCTAVIVEKAETATSPDQWEILGTRLATQFSNNIRNNFGFMNRAEDSDPLARDKTFRQEGRKVFKEVVPLAAAHIEAHLAQLGFEPKGVRRFWLHQANLGMNQFVIRKLVGQEVGGDLAPLILDEYANTASAGSIVAFHHHHADMAPGEVGVICSFGAGYSVGSVVVRKL